VQCDVKDFSTSFIAVVPSIERQTRFLGLAFRLEHPISAAVPPPF
jgi:hypothetical protein